MRPERIAALCALLSDGRIEAGPWYVLADELIPSGEALVRNLSLGRDTIRRLGASASRVLYCPDSFGHPSILPDLAAGFDCDLIVLWRGLAPSKTGSHDTVRWWGAGGASVLVYHLPPDGYEFGSNLPAEELAARERWNVIVAVMGSRANTGVGLLMNGADHHARQNNLVPAVEWLKHASGDVRIWAASMSAAANVLVRAANDSKISEISGELRDSYGYTWTLQGTLASRASQKRRNACAERSLVRDLEPWLALHTLANIKSASGNCALLWHAWRTLLSAHPHDTICGTSIDAVAGAFDQALGQVEAQSSSLRQDCIGELLNHDRDAARASNAAWRPAALLRNPSPRKRGGVVELTLAATIADIAVGPGSAARQGSRRMPAPWGIAGIPLQILSDAEDIQLTEALRAYPDADLVRTASAVGWVEPMTGYSLQTRLLGNKSRADVPHPVRADGFSLGNGKIRVDVDDEGKVAFRDAVVGQSIADLFSFENNSDVGDLYTPAIRKAIRPIKFRSARVVHRGPLRGEIALEFQTYGSSRRKADFCRVTLQVDANSQALRVLVSGDNRSIDHRLRIRFNTGIADAATIADAAFHPVKRIAIRSGRESEVIEKVVATAPLHRWVARVGPDLTIALASDGLAEYESTRNGCVAITLLRAVGELSRVNLPERPGHAGWPASTPAAQCLGPFSAGFSIRVFQLAEPALLAAIEEFCDDFLLPITGETLRSNLLGERQAGGIELSGPGLAFSAALPSSREGWVTLRCVNRHAHAVEGRWTLSGKVNEAIRVKLNETEIQQEAVDNNSIRFIAGPKEIVTLLVR